MKKYFVFKSLLSVALLSGLSAQAEEPCQVLTGDGNKAAGSIIMAGNQFYFLPLADAQQALSSQNNLRYLDVKSGRKEIIVEVNSNLASRTFGMGNWMTVKARVKVEHHVSRFPTIDPEPFLNVKITGNIICLKGLADVLSSEAKDQTMYALRDSFVGGLVYMQYTSSGSKNEAIAFK
jgi:hypothetical protein